MRSPFGCAQSSGTDSDVHSMSPQSCQVSEPVRCVEWLLEHDASRADRRGASPTPSDHRDRGAMHRPRRETHAARQRTTGDRRRGDGRGRARSAAAALVFRLSSRADPAFLAEMLYEAVNWRDDGAEERPPLDELLAQPELRRYVDGWGRKGDVAIVALDRLDEPVGAAWYRVFDADAPGYGFVADDVPELSIAVYPECRGQHVGGLLLGSAREPGPRRRVPGDQPERRRRESGPPAVRAARVRGRHAGRRRRRRRFAHDGPRPRLTRESARLRAGDAARRAERMQPCRHGNADADAPSSARSTRRLVGRRRRALRRRVDRRARSTR